MRHVSVTVRGMMVLAGLLALCASDVARGADAERSFDPRDAGARGDGKQLDTAAIQTAIDKCAAAGGGRVVLSGGTFLSGSLRLKSNVTLYIDKSATLRGSRNKDDYPMFSGVWEGRREMTHSALVGASDAQEVGIAGEGTIDGDGADWWKAHKAAKKGDAARPPRPRLVEFENCRKVRIEGVTLKNSPSWTIHPLYCADVLIKDVKVSNPPDSPNTDGIDPDSCRHMQIVGCTLDCGDDCIAIKSGRDEEGRKVGRPCEDLEIHDCTMLHGHGGVAIGSEMSGGVKGVKVSRCTFDGTEAGIRLKTRRGRGGVVEDIHFDDITMKNVKTAITINMYYQMKEVTGKSPMDARIDPEPLGEGTPKFRDIHIHNVNATGSTLAAELIGLPESPVLDLEMKDISLQAEKGLMGRFGKGWRFVNVMIDCKGKPLVVKDVEGEGITGGQ